jgi:hypothetical protein
MGILVLMDEIVASAVTGIAAAGSTALVQAATTDAWINARRLFMRLVERWAPDRAVTLAGPLDRTRTELATLGGIQLEAARRAHASRWRTRLQDLIDDYPNIETDLQHLVDELRADAKASTVITGSDSVAVGGDVVVHAEGGSLATVGPISGGITMQRPPWPGRDRT